MKRKKIRIEYTLFEFVLQIHVDLTITINRKTKKKKTFLKIS